MSHGTDPADFILGMAPIVQAYVMEHMEYCDSWRALPELSGVYFLYNIKRDSMVYVGKAYALRVRWLRHPLRGLVDGGGYRIYYCPLRAGLDQIEAFFILTLMPENNRIVKAGVGGMRFFLGMREHKIEKGELG